MCIDCLTPLLPDDREEKYLASLTPEQREIHLAKQKEMLEKLNEIVRKAKKEGRIGNY